MSRYYDQPTPSWRYIAGMLTGFVIGLVLAIAAPSSGQELAVYDDAPIEFAPADMVEIEPMPICPGNSYWQPELEMCIVKPPTPEQRRCIEDNDKRDEILQAMDVASTGVSVLALGGVEVGLSSLAGPAMPVALIALKLLSNHSKKATMRQLMNHGEYDQLCKMLKIRNGITGTAVISNAAMIAGGL